jgi:predicted nucleic acid-binding protein
MEGFPSRYVIDANILIDLQNGGLLPHFFSLKVHLVTPDVVIDEIRGSGEIRHEYSGLRVEELQGRLVSEAMSVKARHKCLSVPDVFALILAKDLGCPILTGDRCMRRAAKEEGISVHGILWCLNQLLQEEALDYEQAISALEVILQKNSRLPLAECQEQLKDWRMKVHRN